MIECAFFGSITRDAEVKTSQAGNRFMRLNVRVENGETAQFINATVFDAEAIADADKLKKGARVYIEGKLSLDTWNGKDGVQRHGLSVRAGHCRLSQIGRNKPAKPKQDFPRDMHAPLGGTAGLNDDVPFAPECR